MHVFPLSSHKSSSRHYAFLSRHPASLAAFSLVELSIVLVILGLLVGGILGGQSLIRAAELRAVTTEHQQWQTAINSFRQRYNAFPGDFGQATRFWTASTRCSGDVKEGEGTATCNGNNNGSIGADESLIFWQHLSNAGLIAGSMSGQLGSISGTPYAPGENVPASKLGGAWMIREGHSPQGGGKLENVYALAQPSPTALRMGFIRPEELWGIDSKMDDGMPATGIVQAFGVGFAEDWHDCVEYTTDAYEYRLDVSNSVCAIAFTTGITLNHTDAESYGDVLDGGEANLWVWR